MANKKDKRRECERQGCEQIFEYKRKEQRFCSPKCARDKTSLRQKRKCSLEECSKYYYCVPSDKKIYCSRSCSAKVNNTGVRRHGGEAKRCAKPGCDIAINKNANYCSADCRRSDKINAWLSGTSDGMWKYAIADFVKDYIAERAGFQCEGIDSRTGQRCTENRIKSNGKTVCQVDHIDGNWQNSRPENLRLLCPTCHALTETWGAGNMGNGRTWKKEYSQFYPKV